MCLRLSHITLEFLLSIGFVCICLVCTMFFIVKIWCIFSFILKEKNIPLVVFCSALLNYTFSFQTNCWWTIKIKAKCWYQHFQQGTLLLWFSAWNVGEVGTIPQFCVSYFFLTARRFGADTLTFPGIFLDRSVSWNTRYQGLSLKPLAHGK